tara:strand:- start:436 stop:1239 length:804 start_codon:yes stop_codon:yes gene_type:complete
MAAPTQSAKPTGCLTIDPDAYDPVDTSRDELKLMRTSWKRHIKVVPEGKKGFGLQVIKGIFAGSTFSRPRRKFLQVVAESELSEIQMLHAWPLVKEDGETYFVIPRQRREKGRKKRKAMHEIFIANEPGEGEWVNALVCEDLRVVVMETLLPGDWILVSYGDKFNRDYTVHPSLLEQHREVESIKTSTLEPVGKKRKGEEMAPDAACEGSADESSEGWSDESSEESGDTSDSDCDKGERLVKQTEFRSTTPEVSSSEADDPDDSDFS